MDDDPSCHWGMTGFLTDDQEDTLKKFLDKVDLEPLRYTVESPTECALRFLRARKFNLEDSMKIVSDALQKFKDVGALLPCPFSALRSFPSSVFVAGTSI